MSKPSKKSPKKIDFAVGGQAIIEGVMMRSPHFYVMAVRRMNGKIIVKKEKYIGLTKRYKFCSIPLLRGVIALYESLKLGMRALLFSNQILLDDIDAEEAKKKGKKKPKKKKATLLRKIVTGILWGLYLVFVFAFALFLFKFLPLLAAEGISRLSPTVDDHYLLFNAIDGATKILVFVLYLLLISLLPDVRRVFGYHGAEHQAIWAYEHEKKLTVKNAQAEKPEHPRCGTSFIFWVLFLSVLIYTVMPEEDSFALKLLERIAALPLIAGISYEVLRITGKFDSKWWMHWVALPGLWIQKITTKKPDDKMQEVALKSLETALKAEKSYKG
ncbi:DUF1385 domain-containing protein [Candidatus Peregrinibacteria bacterium]|jgi:uncharacterized protein YqhQ|nr:DUF1385 domain-containing protein [Candidatus Peregrinibacteria bacterium]MBT7702597.1 DUF1385 domain-containing protein [Candidatus Peregrinibacteria bacterium]